MAKLDDEDLSDRSIPSNIGAGESSKEKADLIYELRTQIMISEGE